MIYINTIEQARYRRQEKRRKTVRGGVIGASCLVFGLTGCYEGMKNLPDGAEYDGMQQVCMTQDASAIPESGVNIANGVSVRKISPNKIEVTRVTERAVSKQQVDCNKLDEAAPTWPFWLACLGAMVTATGVVRTAMLLEDDPAKY